MYTNLFEMCDAMKARAVGLALAAVVTLAGGAEAATLADCEGGITMSAPGVVKCAGQTLISCAGGTVIDSTGAVVCAAAAPEAVPVCTLASSAGFVQNAYTLTANCSPAAASYVWSDAGCSSTSKTCTVATTVTKDYTVAGKNSAGTAGATATKRVTVGSTAPAPTPTPTPTGKPACTLVALEGFQVGKIQVQANCSPVATSYTWGGTGFSSTVAYGYLTTPTTTTTYSVTGCNASGCSAQASTTYTVSAVVPACTLTASTSLIAPDGNSTLTASCSPAATGGYVWTGVGCAANTTNSCSVTLHAGSEPYTVAGTNAVGTGAPSAAATVTVAPPSCTLTASASSIAPDGTSILTASCSPAATGGYVWTGVGCAANTTNSCSVTLHAGSEPYTVAGTNAVGTGVPSAAATVTVAPPSCTLTASASTISLGGSSTLTANCTSTPTSYTWTGGTCAGSTTSSCTVTPGATTPYTVRATNAAGTSSAAAATVTVIIPGACTLVNTNIPITYLTDFGHNFNQRMSRGESVSYQFTTPDRESPGGTIVKDNSTIGLPVEGFINVSTSQCDFTYPTLVAPWNTLDATWNGCGNWFASGSLQYHVEYVDSHQIGRCSLRPNTTYYINIRNESQGNLGVDTCPQGVTCGFLFNMNGS